MWIWRDGTYFGVPPSNFAGWFISSLAFFAVIAILKGRSLPSRGSLFVLGPLSVYFAYLVDGASSNISLGQGGAAVIGSCLMVFVAAVAISPRFLVRGKAVS
jgi:uncharacterized membrane protein